MSDKTTTHSVNFINEHNIAFDLVFTKNNISAQLASPLSNIVFEEGYSDSSSNATSVIEVPLENFDNLFKIKLKTKNITSTNLEYFVDYTQWNNNKISQDKIYFSNSIVQPYDGSLNKGPINPSHKIQTLKRDLARSVFNAIPSIDRLNNLQIFQNKIVKMIEDMDENFHNQIIEKLKKISNYGYRDFNNIENNPLRIIIGSILITDDELTLGIDSSNSDILSFERSQHLTDIINNKIDFHIRNISNYCYYIDILDTSTNNLTYYGPLFLTKETAITTAFALNRFVNLEINTVDSLPLIELTFDEYNDYKFYAIPGDKYNNGSYNIYDNLDVLIENIYKIKELDIWKGNFIDSTEIILSFPFIDNDKISLLLKYEPDNLNFQIFNETFGNFNNNIIEPRTYEVQLKLKQTKITETITISFTDILLSLLKNSKFYVQSILDVVKIRIELEIHVYHRGLTQLSDNDKLIIDELKNTTSLPYIFDAIQSWQNWYKNWYIVGNPTSERQIIFNNINDAKNEILNLNQTVNIIEFLLNNIE